jgi:tRNA 2-thiouridine synthesizing protein A
VRAGCSGARLALSLRRRTSEKGPFRAAAGGAAPERVGDSDRSEPDTAIRERFATPWRLPRMPLCAMRAAKPPFSHGEFSLTGRDVFIICCFSNMKRRPLAARPGVGLCSVSRMTTMAAQLLDAKGLNCPLPILKAKKALKDVPVGGQLEVLATDPGSVADFQAFCRATGNELVESTQDSDVFRVVIKRCA